jgi:hypothetical protein
MHSDEDKEGRKKIVKRDGGRVSSNIKLLKFVTESE